MKKFFASIVALFLCVPAAAFAQSTDAFHATVDQLMVVVAALDAQAVSIESGQSLSCAALFSMPSVHLHEDVALAWGTVGAIDPEVSSTSQSMWAPHGVSTLSFSKPGTWKYSFTFYGEDSASTTCDAYITVVQ